MVTSTTQFIMKKPAPIFILFLMIVSCSSEMETGLEEFNALGEFDPVGEWTLVKISGPQVDEEQTGEEIEFFETYLLNRDGTFTKTRTEGNSTTKISGKYILSHYWPAINPEPVIAYVNFTYASDSKIISTCGDSLMERFYFTPDYRLVSSQKNCEGMVFTYRRIH